MKNDEFANDARFATGRRALRIGLLAVLFSAAAILESGKLSSVADAAIWGHLRMGSWIVEHRSWPETGLFSQASRVRWMDFTWAYDVLAALMYRVLGLRAIPALLMVLRVALAVILFLLGARGGRGDFRVALAVSALTQYALFDLGPGAGFISAICFGVQLLLLLEARRSGRDKPLFAMPVLFLVWANLDIEFVYGIATLGLFLVTLSLEQAGRRAGWSWLDAGVSTIRARPALAACGLSLLATLLTPYTFHAYVEFFAAETSTLNRLLPGYTAMSFHGPLDYVLLLLVMAAALRLGRRRSRDIFLLGLLAGCAALSFHAQRVNWLVAIAAAAVIGETSMAREEKASPGVTGAAWRTQVLIPASLAAVLATVALLERVPGSHDELLRKAATHFPVRACGYIREHRLPAPLFNSYLWGSFVTWYLPEYPVAIDFRRGLYPEEEEATYFKVMNAELPYQGLPSLEQAGTLLLEEGTVMAETLAGMSGFQAVYEDDISVVLLRENLETGMR